MDREHKGRGSSTRSRELAKQSDDRPSSSALPKYPDRPRLLDGLKRNVPALECSRQEWESMLSNGAEHSHSSDNESDVDSDAYHTARSSSDTESEHSHSSDIESDVYFDALEPDITVSDVESDVYFDAPEPDITVDEVKALKVRFKLETQAKQGKFRKKGRGRIFRTVDDLIEQFYQCSSQENRNQIADNIIRLCDGWKKKHKYTIIQNESYKKIHGHLIDFENSIQKLKGRHLDIQGHADENKTNLNKTLGKAEKLIAKYKYYEGTPEGFFNEALPSILDLISPDTGDKTEFDTLLRFPVQPGVFVGVRTSIGIERKEDNELKVNFEGNVQAGATVHGIAAIGGEFGVWCECIAKDSKSAGKLLDYGLYRRFRESNLVPRQVTNKLWGGKTDIEGYKKSEEKAAQIEKDIFGEEKDENNFTDEAKKSQVEWGTNGGLISDFKIHGIGAGKASAQIIEAQRYSQYTIDQTKGTEENGSIEQGSGVGKTDFSKLHTLGPQKTKGQGSHRVVLSNSGSFGGVIGKYGIDLKLDLCSKTGSKFKENHINKWEIELDGGANIPAAAFANKPLLALAPISISILEALRSMGAQAEKKYKTKSQKAGAFLGNTKDLAAQLTTAFAGPHTANKVPELLGKNTSKIEGLVGLNVNFKLAREAKPDEQIKDGKANLDPLKAELAIQKTGSTAVKFLDNEIRLETAKRIMQWKWQHGKQAKLELYPLTWKSTCDSTQIGGERWSPFQMEKPKGPLIPMAKEYLRANQRNNSNEVQTT